MTKKSITPGGNKTNSPDYGITGGEDPTANPWKTRIRQLLDQMNKNKKEASQQMTPQQIGAKIKNSGWKTVDTNRFKQPIKVKDPQGNTWGLAGIGVWKIVG